MKDEIRAIPTIYNGVQLRSRLEGQCALLFDRLRWKWEYEKTSYMLPNGISYMPDFTISLPVGPVYVIEVRGYKTQKGQAQLDGFLELINQGDDDTPFSPIKFAVIGEPCKVNFDDGLWVGWCISCGWRIAILNEWKTCGTCSAKSYGSYEITVRSGKVRLGSLTSDQWEADVLADSFMRPLWAKDFLRETLMSCGREREAFAIEGASVSRNDGLLIDDPDVFDSELILSLGAMLIPQIHITIGAKRP